MNSVDGSDAESLTSNKNDHDLTTDHDAVDPDEPKVAVDALEDIEFVVETSVVELVEDLHPNESVENHGGQLLDLIGVASIVT